MSMSNANNSKCLLLNADMSPLRIISWRRAIIWSLKNIDYKNYNIDIIAYYKNRYIQGANNKQYSVPAVAKTVKYFDIYNRKINFSRHNLFIRDNFTCQYCNNKYPIAQLTYDHIVPKSRFYPNRKYSTNWHNIVTACRDCNHKKGNRTPIEAGMNLIKTPTEPKYSLQYLPWYKELITIYQESISNEWEPFLPLKIHEHEKLYIQSSS